MKQYRYHLIPQEVLEEDFRDDGESYRSGKWLEKSDFSKDEQFERLQPDFSMAEQWIISPEEDAWVVLSRGGMYRKASASEDRACREWIKA